MCVVCPRAVFLVLLSSLCLVNLCHLGGKAGIPKYKEK